MNTLPTQNCAQTHEKALGLSMSSLSRPHTVRIKASLG